MTANEAALSAAMRNVAGCPGICAECTNPCEKGDRAHRVHRCGVHGGQAATVHPSPILAKLAKKAKSPQTGLFPGNEDPVGFWLTPPELMERFQAEFGFTFDACPYPRPAGFDGTKEPWGSMTYVNPPFEGPRPGFTAWIKKAIQEKEAGNGSVLIFPMDGWVSLAIQAGATFRPVGPHDWIDGRTGKRQKASRPSMLIIFPSGKQVKE